MTGRIADKQYVFGICAVLVLATAGLYWQVQGCEFVSFDDESYVTKNEQVLNGLSQRGFVWAFTSTRTTSNWHPLTWLSLMLDCELFEQKARACHITNLLFHLANTLLLFMVLRKMTAALWRSAFVAALFALHTLHVESVAWVSERKDVLSTFFWLLTMWAYVRYVRHPRFAAYITIVVFFALGLMAKPMLVTLPFVLLIMDYWPLRRLQLIEPDDKTPANGEVDVGNPRKTAVALVKEKIPLFVLTAISCVVTYLAQQSGGAVQSMETVELKVRLANAIVSYVGYMNKMIWPGRLAVFYPPLGTVLTSKAIQAALVLAVISAIAIRWRRHRPYLLAGWLWYLGTLVPVIGFVQVGGQAMADRYTYVPLTGLFIAIAWGFNDLSANWRYRRIVLGTSAAVVLTALMIYTWRQVGYWQNSITLYEQTLVVTQRNPLMHNNLGLAWLQRGNLDKAIEHHRKAVQMRPDYATGHSNLAMVLAFKRQYAEAIMHYRESLRIDPDQYVTHNNLGTAILSSQGPLQEAEAQFRESLRLEPDYDNAHLNLATVLLLQDKPEQAIQHYRELLRLNPNDSRARKGLQAAISKRDKPADQQQKKDKPSFHMVPPQ